MAPTLATVIRMFDKISGADVDVRAWANGDGTYASLPMVGPGDAWAGDFLLADQAVAIRDVGLTRATYRASVSAMAASSSGGFAISDVFTLSPSSSNPLVTRPKKIGVSLTGGAGQYVDVQLNRRSTRDSSGTAAAAVAIVPLDPSDPASSAVVNAYTGSPSSSAGLGTLVGQVAAVRLFAPSSSAASQTYPWEFDLGERAKSVALRASTDVFAVTVVPDIVGTPFRLDIWAEWAESAA